jgi:hypothetical protein
MWFFGALLIVSFPAWWLTAAIFYISEFYYLAAGSMALGCASLLLVGKIAGSRLGRRGKHQDILPVSDAAESIEFDALGM